MRRIQRRKKPVDYLLPFLIIISVGVIVVLGYQLFINWYGVGKADVYFYVAEGKAKVLPYAHTEWDNAFSGTKLLIGDSLKTSSKGKVIMQFFNGTYARMSEDTEINLMDVSKASDKETIALNMDNGKLWLKGKKSDGVKESHYEVKTKNLVVKATGTVFEVEAGDTETVRVFDGDVNVDVMVTSDNRQRVAETINVGVGQEITIDDAALKAFADNNKPSVLKAVADDFKQSSWFAWNNAEDLSPTDYKSRIASTDSANANASAEQSAGTTTTDTASTDTTSTDTANPDTSTTTPEDTTQTPTGIQAPVITKPTEMTVTNPVFVISGTVGTDATKVVVESDAAGTKDSYTLGKFKAGDTSWSYNVSDKYGNIKPGENVYDVYAYDKDGNKSEPAEITITYNKETPTTTDSLTDPKVLTFNGGTSNVVTTNVVKVAGEVKGAEKIVVNDYTLSKYVAESTEWAYNASESAGNLKPGLNEYQVYAIDADGNKSNVVKFTITYNKETTTSSPTTPATPIPSSGSPSYGF